MSDVPVLRFTSAHISSRRVGLGEAREVVGSDRHFSHLCVKPHLGSPQHSPPLPHVSELQTRDINIHQVCYYYRRAH